MQLVLPWHADEGRSCNRHVVIVWDEGYLFWITSRLCLRPRGIQNPMSYSRYRDTFDILPGGVQPSKGIQVPALKWFRAEMKSLITDDLLSEDCIVQRSIWLPWNDKLKRRLFSSTREIFMPASEDWLYFNGGGRNTWHRNAWLCI
jgi:hypothetical protein